MSRESTREPVTVRGILKAAAAGLVIGIAVFALRGGFAPEDRETFWVAVCDAFAVPGLLLTCTGLLSAVSGQGAFDGLNFSVRKAFGQILSEERRNAMPRTFYDYVEMKREKRGKKPRTVLYTGLGFLALAGAALAVYSSIV